MTQSAKVNVAILNAADRSTILAYCPMEPFGQEEIGSPSVAVPNGALCIWDLRTAQINYPNYTAGKVPSYIVG